MRHYGKCECGRCEWFGSDGPGPCKRCDECGTGPGGRTPEDHQFVPRFNPSTGNPDGGLCMRCYERDKNWEHP